MDINDLWSIYELASEEPSVTADAVFLFLALAGTLMGLVTFWRISESFGGALIGMLVGAVFGSGFGLLLGVMTYSSMMNEHEDALVLSVQERAAKDYKVDVPTGVLHEVIFGDENISTNERDRDYEPEQFIGTVDGETMMVYVDFDQTAKSVTIGTDSPEVERKTNLNVLTDH